MAVLEALSGKVQRPSSCIVILCTGLVRALPVKLNVSPCVSLQPVKLSERLNTLLLSMCTDSTLMRMSVRTALDACSAHIRSSSAEPSFSYVRRLVRLVLGSLSQVTPKPPPFESMFILYPSKDRQGCTQSQGAGLDIP